MIGKRRRVTMKDRGEWIRRENTEKNTRKKTGGVSTCSVRQTEKNIFPYYSSLKQG